MNKKTIFKFLFYILLLLSAVACKQNNDIKSQISSIQILASKNTVSANLVDYITFDSKIYDSEGAQLVDAKPKFSAFLVDDNKTVIKEVPITEGTFKTSQVGNYKIVASYNGANSNELFVSAFKGLENDNGVYLETNEFALTNVENYTFDKLLPLHTFSTAKSTTKVALSNLITSKNKAITSVIADGMTITPNGSQYLISLNNEITNIEIQITQTGAQTLRKNYTFQIIKISDTMDITQLNIFNSNGTMLDTNFDTNLSTYNLSWEYSLYYSFSVYTLNTMKLQISVNNDEFTDMLYVQETFSLRKWNYTLSGINGVGKTTNIKIKAIAPNGNTTVYSFNCYVKDNKSLLSSLTFNGGGTSKTVTWDSVLNDYFTNNGTCIKVEDTYQIKIDNFPYSAETISFTLGAQSSKAIVQYSIDGGKTYYNYSSGAVINMNISAETDTILNIKSVSEDKTSTNLYSISLKRTDTDCNLNNFEFTETDLTGFNKLSFLETKEATITKDLSDYASLTFALNTSSKNSLVYFANTHGSALPLYAPYSKGQAQSIPLSLDSLTDTGTLWFKVVNGDSEQIYKIYYYRYASNANLSNILFSEGDLTGLNIPNLITNKTGALNGNLINYSSLNFTVTSASSKATIYWASAVDGETPSYNPYQKGQVTNFPLKATLSTQTGYLYIKIVNGSNTIIYKISYKRYIDGIFSYMGTSLSSSNFNTSNNTFTVNIPYTSAYSFKHEGSLMYLTPLLDVSSFSVYSDSRLIKTETAFSYNAISNAGYGTGLDGVLRYANVKNSTVGSIKFSKTYGSITFYIQVNITGISW